MILSFVTFNFLTALVFANDSKGYHNSIGIPAAEKRLEMEKRVIERDPEFRIAGGSSLPSYNVYPWLAGVIAFLSSNTLSMCGASLLTANRLITAGHCWIDSEQKALKFQVVLGSVYLFCTNLHCGGIRVNTSHVVVHPGWNPSNLNTVDAAVIYLPYRIYFTPEIYPIALPLNNLMDSFEGYSAIIAGYGRIDGIKYSPHENPIVNHVAVTVISNDECIQWYSNKTIRPTHMCTSGERGVGICQGDSGGPLISIIDDQYTVIGIDVLGYAEGCNQNYPSVYLRITNIIDFIIGNLNLENSI